MKKKIETSPDEETAEPKQKIKVGFVGLARMD